MRKNLIGKNALVLSGGGSRGGYEIGVWQALREMDIPLHIVTGASVGALNGAIIVQNDFDLAVGLWKELETYMVFDMEKEQPSESGRLNFEIAGMSASEALSYAREIVTNGGAGTSGLEKLLHQYVSEEKIRRSDTDFGVVTVEFPSLKPHYLFRDDIPPGKLLDYILASASCFPAVQAKEIDGVKYIDGGYADVMPVELAMKRGADNIIAVHLEAAGFVRKDTLEFAEETASSLHLIKCPWDLGNFLVFDTDNTKRILRLGYLDTMKAFGRFDGIKYTFTAGELTPHQREGAEAAAEIFGLDPLEIYSSSTLNRQLAEAAAKAVLPEIKDIPSLENLLASLPKLAPEALVLHIAHHLQEHGADSLFTGQAAVKLLGDEVRAANYLLHNHLLPAASPSAAAAQ